MTRVALLLVALSLVLPATTQTAPQGNTIKIGAFLSLTGATAAYGISASNAIKLATDEVNRNGGVDGKLIELVVEDDHSNIQEVPGIVNKLIKEGKVDALIAVYGLEPDAGAATAYDAARMLFDAFGRAKSKERSAVRDALAQTKDFAGVTGKITLDANRNAQVPVYMLRIEKGGKFTLQQ